MELADNSSILIILMPIYNNMNQMFSNLTAFWDLSLKYENMKYENKTLTLGIYLPFPQANVSVDFSSNGTFPIFPSRPLLCFC